MNHTTWKVGDIVRMRRMMWVGAQGPVEVGTVVEAERSGVMCVFASGRLWEMLRTGDSDSSVWTGFTPPSSAGRRTYTQYRIEPLLGELGADQ